MIVREALVADPRVLPGDASLREAAELLTHPNVKSVIVTDGERLLGCITTETIVAAVSRGADPVSTHAREVCEEMTTVGPEMPLDEALHLMAEQNLERLAVTDDGRLLGVLPREPAARRLAEDEPA